MYRGAILLILVLFIALNTVNGCTEGEQFRTPFSCVEYDTCVNGVRLRRKCELGKFFDGQECDYMWKVSNCIIKSCDEGKKYVRGSVCLPDFDYCFLGKIFKKTCPKEQRFNGKECVPSEQCKKIDYHGKAKQKRIVRSNEPECKDQTITSNPTDCTTYRECEHGAWVVKKCNWLQHFDSVTNKCQYYGYICASEKESCTKEGDTRSVYARCSEYEQCVNNHWETKECSKDTYFQGGSCQNKFCPLRPVVNNCTLFKEPGSNKELPCPVDELFDMTERQCVPQQDAKCFDGECEDGDTTYVASDCTKYNECKNGKWELQSCSWLSHFDFITRTCKYYGYNCGTDKLMTTTSTNVHSSTLQPQCSENDKRAVPGDCKRYRLCKNGKWVDNRCSVWGKFDAVTKQCYYFMIWNVSCAY